MKTFHYASIAEITASVRSKKLSPVEIVNAHLKRIEAMRPKLNAFVHIDADGARAQARRAENAVHGGAALGPLHGVPITIKSCIDVAGWSCPSGSLLRKDYVAPSDAPLVARLREAGAILLGNTNTPEFLMAYEPDNLVSGKTSNSWDLSRSAGGSSGGEAAAIAAGCSAGGVGSDGGGSIRAPAHFCGICGLKPTPGRIPATGHFPAGAGAFSWNGVVGPMSRSIADAILLLAVMAGPDPGDGRSRHSRLIHRGRCRMPSRARKNLAPNARGPHPSLPSFLRSRFPPRRRKLPPRDGLPGHHALFTMAELDRFSRRLCPAQSFERRPPHRRPNNRPPF